jgi:hypothetical protein
MNEQINPVEVVKQEVLPISDQAKMIMVKDQASLQKANMFFLDIKALRKKIAEVFNPIISKAHAAHQEALKQKADAEAPLILAEKYLNGQVTDYKREQDRIRAEEEERNRLEAIRIEAERRQKEEDERLAKAAELEASGAKEEAEAVIQEAIEEKEKPIEPYIPPPSTPKVELNGATVKTYWHAEVTDLRALCKAIGDGSQPTAYVEAKMPVLNTLATRLKKELNIPGVKAVSTTSMAATGKNKG